MDAFTLNWFDYKPYIFPPFSILQSVLQKLAMDKATALVIMPNWSTQPFFPKAMKMLIKDPTVICKSKRLLRLPSQPDRVHDIWNKLDLLAVLLSGDQSLTRDYQQQLQTFCTPHGGLTQQNSMNVASESGKFTVIDGKLISFKQL